MNDPIAQLKRDHRDVAAMLKTLDASKPGARRRATLDKLVKSLELHMEIEETAVYPLVAERVDEDDAKEARIEHGLARDGLAKLQELVDAPGFGAAVAMVTAGIKHHVKEEEQEIFPQLKKKLDRDELRALGDRVATAEQGGRRRPRRLQTATS
jgi:hemerythrin-like domain-containing protein